MLRCLLPPAVTRKDVGIPKVEACKQHFERIIPNNICKIEAVNRDVLQSKLQASSSAGTLILCLIASTIRTLKRFDNSLPENVL